MVYSTLYFVDAKLAGGGGFSYLFARCLGLRVGLHITVGFEDTVIYMGAVVLGTDPFLVVFRN
jgi:hypothetical protein